jgi:hypothetical protein
MPHIYELLRTATLDFNGVVVDMPGDGVVCAFPAQDDIPGLSVKAARSREEAAVRAAVQAAAGLSNLLKPGSQFWQDLLRACQVSYRQVQVKLSVSRGSTLVGTYGPREGRGGSPLPLELLALGHGPTFGHVVCECARYKDLVKRYAQLECKSRYRVLPKEHQDFLRAWPSVAAGVGPHAVTLVVDEIIKKIGQQALDTFCALVPLADPLPFPRDKSKSYKAWAVFPKS